MTDESIGRAGWFSDRVLLGRVLVGLGGYLGAYVALASASWILIAVAVTGLVLVIAGLAILIRRNRGLGGLGLAVGGFVAAFAMWIYPFGPAFLVGGLLLLGVPLLLALVPAPARNRRALSRASALLLVLLVTTAALGVGAYEAWVVWPEAFSRDLTLDETWALLRDDELESVMHTARLWVGMTVVGLAALMTLAVVPAAKFGVRRILAFGFGLAAAALVNLQLGAWPVGWNLTDYGQPDGSSHLWALAVRVVEAVLFAAAFLIAALRRADESHARRGVAARVQLTGA